MDSIDPAAIMTTLITSLGADLATVLVPAVGLSLAVFGLFFIKRKATKAINS